MKIASRTRKSAKVTSAITNKPSEKTSEIIRFSSLEGRLDHAFLSKKLNGAKSYKRIAGYFRSSILELVGEEIESIPDVRIVCNSELDPHDITVSKAARDAMLKEKWNQVSVETEGLLFASHYRKLYKLLISGRVKIKVVAKNNVFLHGKAGVIELADGSRTSFLGSVNESRAAFSHNYEILWEDTSQVGADWVDREFELLWKQAHDLPDAILTEIKRVGERVEVSFGELIDSDVPAAVMVESPIYRGGEQLQPWQRSFVTTFMEHRKVYGKSRLLLADEVGLGKTLSMATSALVATLLGDGPTLILCPATLTLQWQTELKDRLGVPSAVWLSNKKQWQDNEGRLIATRGAEDVVRCPFQIAIVSTGLIVKKSVESQILRKARIGTLILDEAHKARMRGGLSDDAEENNLLDFMRDAALNARHVLLGTATPIQTAVRELWDLVGALNQGAPFVLGKDYASRWRVCEQTHPIITGMQTVTEENDAWDLIRSPLPPRNAPMMDHDGKLLIGAIRTDLNLEDGEFFTSKSATDLDPFTRSGDLANILGTDFFRRNNPFIRHVVLRRRKTLEDAGLLEKIGVNLHPDPNASSGTYTGVVFDELGLMTNRPFEIAYEAAEGFVEELSKRSRTAGLLRSIFLQRICSSFASGLLTVERMLERQVDDSEDNPQMEIEQNVLRTLTDAEIDYLEVIREELSRPDAVDPKLNAAKWFLQHHKSQGKTWCELGCIIFSQYFDTAKWVASELTKDYPDHIVAVYAGAGKSGLYKDGRFVSIERETIKKMVKTREITLVVATDAACEGLNLQTLGTLINIDLPWNPSRLEQRLGRIKRFGQARKNVDMLNLVYHETRDEDVYRKISERMKDRFDIFGGVPDCVDDDWIDGVEEFEEMARTHLHMRGMTTNIFEEKWGQTVVSGENRWDECTRVLSHRDIEKAMSRPWITK